MGWSSNGQWLTRQLDHHHDGLPQPLLQGGDVAIIK